MTCYEALRAAPPAADAPMAHHLVKWWRNKFRNGYKKFSIGTESERTDTEELVGRAASQCSAPPDLLPCEARALLRPRSPATPPPPPLKRHVATQKHPPSPTLSAHNNNNNEPEKQPRLRFEELTCDVELQHAESSKRQPLQFSFTLYDLDGHGRMTKDDIAGIVSTIYESIGKSVTVPHYGSKTIQVRLTVVPEDDCVRARRERHEGRRRRRRERHATNTNVSTPPECPDISEHERERLSGDDDISSKSSSSGDRRPQRPPPPQQPRTVSKHLRKEQRHKQKKRSGSLQRKELLEIIQANMEKNHMSFQPSRKPHEPAVNVEDITSKYQKLRNRSHTISEKPLSNAFHKVKTDSGHGYLDLAGSGGGGDSNLCRYDRYLHAVICSSARHAHTGYHQKHQHKQARSRVQPPPPPPPPERVRPSTQQETNDTPSSKPPRVLQIIFL